jgi:hypothetical protein
VLRPSHVRYEIRTPRRPDGFAAQLWVDAGFWLVGRGFEMRADARRAGGAFAETRPLPPQAGETPPANWTRRRRKPDDAPRWTRRVKGGGFQGRVHLGHDAGIPLGPDKGFSLNLGLFVLSENDYDWRLTQWCAARAAREFMRVYRPHAGFGLREALEHLKRKGWIPERVLPPRVKRVADGYMGFVRKRGQVLQTGVRADPWEAYREMNAVLEREFSPRDRKAS